jgi:hypothetical protein
MDTPILLAEALEIHYRENPFAHLVIMRLVPGNRRLAAGV